MKKSDLINELNKISNEDFEIVLVDWLKNLSLSEGAGMYSSFDVTLEENANEDSEHKYFIAFSFENDDYDENGNLRNFDEDQFSHDQIQQLQSKVHKITGDGEVMVLFNELLGIKAG